MRSFLVRAAVSAPCFGTRREVDDLDGGNYPQWSQVGNELLYQGGDQVMAVSYSVKGETFVAESRGCGFQR
jgi:hypothetical protein